MAGKLWIYCADIGSVKTGRFGWCGDSEDGEMMFGDSIDELAGTVAKKSLMVRKSRLVLNVPYTCPSATNQCYSQNQELAKGTVAGVPAQAVAHLQPD